MNFKFESNNLQTNFENIKKNILNLKIIRTFKK